MGKNDQLPIKRQGPSTGPESKRGKHSEGESDSEEADRKCTPQEIVEIRKLNKVLKQAYKDAPHATKNALIYHRVSPVPWNLVSYDMGKEEGIKTLANRFLNEEGWTNERMVTTLSNSPIPIAMFPLNRAESRALWESVRYRVRLKTLRTESLFEVDIPEEWLTSKYKGKPFKDTNALEYGKELVALIAFNQRTFLSHKPYRFRGICEDLGWELSGTFCEFLFVVLFMICAKPSSVKTITDAIKAEKKGVKKGTWGESGVQKAVKKAFKEAAIKAEKKGEIRYKQSFKLLKVVFPNGLK